MVLKGREFSTIQFAFLPHGLSSEQGFLHLPSKHANLLGQSTSLLHSSSYLIGLHEVDGSLKKNII